MNGDTKVAVSKQQFLEYISMYESVTKTASDMRDRLNAIIDPARRRYMLIVNMEPDKRSYDRFLIQAIDWESEILSFNSWTLQDDKVEWFVHYQDHNGEYEEGTFSIPLDLLLDPNAMDRFETDVNQRIQYYIIKRRAESAERKAKEAETEKEKRRALYLQLKAEFEHEV